MGETDFHRELYVQFARIGKALSNANRLELLDFLAQGERSVEALARASGLTMANTSQHLQQLRQAGLVDARKHGQHVYYSLCDESLVDLLGGLRGIAARSLAEVGRLVNCYLTARDNLEPIAAEELLARLRAGLVTVMDVRPEEEYAAGHVAGAVNVPLEQLSGRLAQLSGAAQVVAYCRGPYCVLAYEAVAQMRRHGIEARRLEGGFPEWKSAGLPVERDAAKVHPSAKSR